MPESASPASRWFNKLQSSITGGAVVVSAMWIVSKVLGLLRQRLIASEFGAPAADPLYAAFSVPDFVYGTLVLGSLLSAFLPVFLKRWQEDREAAWETARSVFNLLVLVFAGLSILILLFAPALVSVVAPGFSGEKRLLTVALTQIMAVNILLFAAGNVLSGVLQAFRRFLAVSVAPILNNLGIIAGILFLAPTYGVRGVAYGAVLGALLHFVVQVAAAFRAGFRFGFKLNLKLPDVRRIGKLILPRAFGQSVTQLDQLVNIIIGSTLAAGSVAIFKWANDVQDVPVTLVGVSLATVAFPVFSEMLARGDRQGFVTQFSKVVRQILFLVIPISVLILQLRAQFVRVIYGAGAIDWPTTIAIANTVGFFTLSLFAQALVPVLARSFYALQDTRTPVIVTTGAVILDIIGSFVLGRAFGVQGLALSYSLSNLLNAAVLYWMLRRRLGNLDDEKVVTAGVRIVGITLLMAVVVQGAKSLLVSLGLDLSRAIGVLAQAVLAGGVGLLSYLLFAALFKLEEASLVRTAISRIGAVMRGNGRRNGEGEAPIP
jgi:putative peptidoglycan lipid II flippase